MATTEATSQTLKAALALRELILEGELQPGERVAEIPLSERIGVSRTPLRLALARLEHEGLLNSLSAGGFVVRQFTREEIADAIELRGVLEGTAARLAAERLREAGDVEALAACAQAMDELVRPGEPAPRRFERYVELNERFHALLVALARSDVVAQAIERVVLLPFASPGAFVQAQADLPESFEVLQQAQFQHHALVDAIRARQGTRAESLAREHSRLALRNLEIALAHAPERLPGAALISD
jgi:GntR family transcriptional regulator, vanillate catabolism transcriptional regulator